MEKNEFEKGATLLTDVDKSQQGAEPKNGRYALVELLTEAGYTIDVETQSVEDVAVTLINRLVDRTEQFMEAFAVLEQAVERDERLTVFFEQIFTGADVSTALLKANMVASPTGAVDGEILERYNRNSLLLEKMRSEHDGKDCDLQHQVNTFCSECEVDATQMEQFAEFVGQLVSAVVDKRIDADMLKTLWKGYKFNDLVGIVKNKALVDGRNMQIDALRSERESGNLHAVAPKEEVENMLKNSGYVERLMLSM